MLEPKSIVWHYRSGDYGHAHYNSMTAFGRTFGAAYIGGGRSMCMDERAKEKVLYRWWRFIGAA